MSQRTVVITSSASNQQRNTDTGRRPTLNERFEQLRGMSRRRSGRTITIRGVGSGGVKKTRRVSSTRRTRLSALRRIATLSQRGSRRRTTSQTGTRLRQRRGQRGRGRGRGRGRASSTRTGSGSGRRKQPTKEALDKELEEYMMSTPETAKKYLNEELDEYWAKAPESVTQTNKEVNGPNSENPSKK